MSHRECGSGSWRCSLLFSPGPLSRVWIHMAVFKAWWCRHVADEGRQMVSVACWRVFALRRHSSFWNMFPANNTPSAMQCSCSKSVLEGACHEWSGCTLLQINWWGKTAIIPWSRSQEQYTYSPKDEKLFRLDMAQAEIDYSFIWVTWKLKCRVWNFTLFFYVIMMLLYYVYTVIFNFFFIASLSLIKMSYKSLIKIS